MKLILLVTTVGVNDENLKIEKIKDKNIVEYIH